jgi:hypothetical protein
MSFSSWPRVGAALTLGLVLVSCGGEKVGPEGTVSFIEISPKTARLYTVGQQVVFTNTITTEAGTAGEGIPVGYMSRDPSLVQVNSTGIATAQKKGGSTYIVVTAGGKSDSAEVEVPTTTCGSATQTTVAVGQILTDVAATGFCAAASDGDYAVIVHNKSISTSGSSSVEINGIAVGTPPAGAAGATFSRSVATGFGLPSGARIAQRNVDFEMRHRRAEAALDRTYGGGAKAWYDSRRKRATFSAAAPAVDDVMSINVQIGGSNDCTATPQLINARVAAISNSAIVVADPDNPPDGYTDDEYNGFAQMFDSIINPLDVATFGAPSDIDSNGRVIFVFTKVINSKSPAGSGSFVGGLTHSRDLLPKSSCPGSNEAELFYLMVPDVPPYTASNGNQFDKAFVNAVTEAGIVHEYQHLINFARRRFLNPGAPQPNEELWLNEGLSHTAEDLLFYRRSGRTPRTNFMGSDINNQGIFDMWRYYVLGNFLNFDEYLLSPNTYSPIQSTDGTGTRGATFAFLRYIADQNFASDGTFWYDLVNSGDVGVSNIEKRLGNMSDANFQTMFRDFIVSLYSDDFAAGIAAKFTQPSWDMRSMYPRLTTIYQLPAGSFDWPLNGIGLKDNQPKSVTLTAGGFQIFRFRGLTGSDSFIRVTGAAGAALPSNVTISMVRTN